MTGLAELNGLPGVKPDVGYPAAGAGVAVTVSVGRQVEPASLPAAGGAGWYQDEKGSRSVRVTPAGGPGGPASAAGAWSSGAWLPGVLFSAAGGGSVNSAPQPAQKRAVPIRCRPHVAQKLMTARPIPVVTHPDLGP